jgi:hypothetical protein
MGILQDQRTRAKHKRILLYYQELDRAKVNHEGICELIFYIFDIGEYWLTKILNKDIEDYRDVKLEHWDLDMKIIDEYVVKIRREAKKARNRQLTLL